MKTHQCPICFGPLEAIPVAPCWDCGHDSEELEHLAQGRHTYAEFTAFGALPIVLCDFCDADFGSYYAAYFGMAGERLVGNDVLGFSRSIDPQSVPHSDKYCPACGHRLAFLNFRAAAIRLNQTAQDACR